jgi:CheY-like chemotaxis protein
MARPGVCAIRSAALQQSCYRRARQNKMGEKPGCTILYVSNDSEELELLELILGDGRNDRVVMCAPDLGGIQSATEKENPDLVLLNFAPGIAGFDGFELYRQLRAVPSLQEIPVLFWRVPNPKAVYPKAQRIGVSGCVHLVFQPKDLLAARDATLRGDTYYPPLR